MLCRQEQPCGSPPPIGASNDDPGDAAVAGPVLYPCMEIGTDHHAHKHRVDFSGPRPGLSRQRWRGTGGGAGLATMRHPHQGKALVQENRPCQNGTETTPGDQSEIHSRRLFGPTGRLRRRIARSRIHSHLMMIIVRCAAVGICRRRRPEICPLKIVVNPQN